jgi:pilus assembly protein Flp/PilA
MRELMKRFLKDQSGASAVEYSLIVALVGVALIAATREVGLQISSVFNRLREALADALRR